VKTFDQIFPCLTPHMLYLIWVDGDEVRMHSTPTKCSLCDNMTRFHSISFQTPYCSIKCLNQEWENYYEASRKEVNNDSTTNSE
jgi:endogenous inhibitor of DNA gyrase (YacG/DUF329 family)